MQVRTSIALLSALLVADLGYGAERSARDARSHPTECGRPLAQRLHEVAAAAPEAAGDDGILFGVQRWRPTTERRYLGLRFPGVLACAYTVSAIFRAACHPIGERASVKSIDQALASWPRIRDPRKLRPGDVVFWKPRRGSLLGFACPGRWHVGISLGGETTVDND